MDHSHDNPEHPGHHPGCDGNCGEVNSKATLLDASEKAIKILKDEPSVRHTPESAAILEYIIGLIRKIATDPTVPDDGKTLYGLETILMDGTRIAGIYGALQTRGATLPSGAPVPAAKLN